MENQFHCRLVICLVNNTRVQATLKFFPEENAPIEICTVELGLAMLIKSEDLNRFNPNGKTIELVRKPDLGLHNILLDFATEEVQEAVLMKLENWGHCGEPTPPTTESSSPESSSPGSSSPGSSSPGSSSPGSSSTES